jgi:L-threonylcarbamoyladenylate synthase
MTRASGPLILVADEDGIQRATDQLLAGGLVALPTETVYGLAARADRDDSVAAIYQVKGRPSFNPLIVHVGSVEQGRQLAIFDSRAEQLAKAFWPGPLTMVLPVRTDAGLSAAVTAGLETVALRCPAHPVMRRILDRSGLALAAPSANRSGGVSPTTAEHVAQSLGPQVDLILDGGACKAGVESTIVALRQEGTWQILRPGPITAEQLTQLLGVPDRGKATAAIEAPGQLASHYAPGKPVRLNALEGGVNEFLIGFGAIGGHVQLSASGDLAEAAGNLYAALHQAASAALPRIAVAPIPHEGLGVAINDRLGRAAA